MSALCSDQICPICKLEVASDDAVKIRQKGADGINEASVRRGDTIAVAAGCTVHSKCRKTYTNSIEIDLHLKQKQSGESSTTIKRSARVSEGPFNSQTDCLFCGTNVQEGKAEYSYVKTDNFAKTILQCCDNRRDEWSFKIKGRIKYYHGDLHAADCVYHHLCSSHFRCGRDIPLQFRTDPDLKRRKSGRPKDEDQDQAFLKMCAYLEMNDEEQLTVSDLRCKMKEYLLFALADAATLRASDNFGDVIHKFLPGLVEKAGAEGGTIKESPENSTDYHSEKNPGKSVKLILPNDDAKDKALTALAESINLSETLVFSPEKKLKPKITISYVPRSTEDEDIVQLITENNQISDLVDEGHTMRVLFSKNSTT
ncbi:hypothetical protein Pmani_021115 [Petrolisthes manimaculis]|uniref:Uncharacterized protein n=1 Tax=Petrolisthes manimaculis TaxID=1843537 RepID=A0AAE1U1Z2_9EUCA|nr:hypothetical protein Pmani_021115 [Petrolisthes manimaculis]